MSEGKKGDFDIFIANSIYPNAASIFLSVKPLDKIKDDCYIVLDTNILLALYTIGEEDLLEQCRKTYGPLSNEKRLVIPGQVAREFAKNRAAKLGELYQQVSKKQLPSMQKGKYPLLSGLNQYKKVVKLEEEIDEKLREYRQIYKKAVDDVLTQIQGWRWNDPVSLFYNEIFATDAIIESSLSQDEIKRDLERRQQYTIPPGYKDRTKDDRGIGDLLIWHTILEIGRTKKKSVIFVSGDEKADWYQRSEGRSLYPRYELVDEFRRYSEGEAFHMVKFSHFLELFGASGKIVEEVRQEEGLLAHQDEVGFLRSPYQSSSKIRKIYFAVFDWLTENFPGSELTFNDTIDDVRNVLIDPNREAIGIVIKIRDFSSFGDDLENIEKIINTTWKVRITHHGLKISKVFIFLIYDNHFIANEVFHSYNAHLISIRQDIALIIGFLETDGKFFKVGTVPYEIMEEK